MSADPAASSSSSSSASAASAASADSLAELDSLPAEELMQRAKRREREEGGVFTKDSELWFAIQLIAAALTKEILTSKFVWKRIPQDMKKKSKDLQIIWKRLVARLRDQVKTDNIDNIRKAYTVIGVEQAAALLGTPKEETAAFLLSLGWTADPQAPSEFFLPTPLALPKQRDISTQQIEQLTSYIVQLERE